jgi:hypothetical protein
LLNRIKELEAELAKAKADLGSANAAVGASVAKLATAAAGDTGSSSSTQQQHPVPQRIAADFKAIRDNAAKICANAERRGVDVTAGIAARTVHADTSHPRSRACECVACKH